jgi:EmrB/QacA subfamily drug resistance transporter
MSISHTASAPAKRRLNPWVIVPLALAQLIIALDIYIVFVAMPQMGAQLGFTSQNLQWIVSAYAVVFGGFLLLGGRAADLLGRRRMFLLGLVFYGASSLVGGFAGDLMTIVVVRAVQGLGGALLFPATLSLIGTLFEEGQPRNRALAIWGGAGASGLTLGSLLGGVLTGAFGWASVFFVNVPVAVAVGLAALVMIPADEERVRGRGFDVPGALTGTAGVALLVYVLVQGPSVGWSSPSLIVSAVLTVVLLVVFALIESRSSDPIMPLRLLRNRSLAASMAITFVFMGTFGTLPYFLTVLFQSVHGFSALRTGLAFLVPAVAIFVGTQIGERITTKITSKVTLIVGFVIGGIGTVLLATAISASSSYAALVPGLVVMGAGQGIAWTGMWIAAASGVSPEEQGIASGIASTTLQVGYAVGLGILVAIANAGVHGLTGDRLHVVMAGGIQTAMYINGVAILVGVLLVLALPGKAKIDTPAQTPPAPVPASAPEPALP